MSETLDAVQPPPVSGVSNAEWEARIELAACYRLCALVGWTDLIYTHISARVPGPHEHFLLNPFGSTFDEVTASSLIKVDLAGNIVAPTEHHIHPAGFVIHSAIHQARPDAKCVMHLHTRSGMALSMLKCGLLPLSQHAMLFEGKVAYHESEGLALDLDERQRLVRDIGDKPVMILRNHGTLIAAETTPMAFSMMWHLEKAMQAQMDALATGKELVLPPAEIAENISRNGFTTKAMSQYGDGASPLGRLEWPALLRRLNRLDPSYRD